MNEDKQHGIVRKGGQTRATHTSQAHYPSSSTCGKTDGDEANDDDDDRST